MKSKYTLFQIVTFFMTISILTSLFTNCTVNKENSIAWDKTFAKSDKVDHRKVSYQNDFGKYPDSIDFNRWKCQIKAPRENLRMARLGRQANAGI